MRQLSPAFIVTSLALAIASGSAFAQLSSAPSETNGLSGTNVTAPVSTATNPSVQSTSSAASNPGAATAAGSNNNPPAANSNPAVTPTPLFELVGREGAAKEASRRARGIEPRVYGIAPRTDRDLTHQMPDDPVIRY